MMVPLFLAALAAVATAQSTTTTSCSESSATSCSESTATVVRCTTSYSEFPLATGVPVPTGFFTTTFTSNYSITSTTQSTITVTPAASTFYDVVNTTTTETTISISTPAATTIPTPAGFFPVLKGGAAAIPGPTATAAALSRHRRASSLQSRARQLDLLRRDPMTPIGNTVGYIVDDDGEGQDLRRIFPVYVECQVSVNINRTSTTVVTGDPVTSVLVPATATAMSTVTFTTTETIVSVAAQPTEYAACQANNVVNNVIGDNNQPIYFDRFIFANPEGFPIMNTLVVNTTSAVNCCIACQRTAFCAGTFYVPTRRECHILLTQAAPTSSVPSLPGPSSTGAPFPFPSSNTSLPYPTASGAPYPAGNGSAFAFPTASGVVLLSTAIPIATPIIAEENGGMSIQPVTEAPLTGTFDRPGAGTCSAGSLSIFLGKAYGREGFDPRKALVISNGPCGREGVDYDQVAAVPREQLAALGAGSLTSSSS